MRKTDETQTIAGLFLVLAASALVLGGSGGAARTAGAEGTGAGGAIREAAFSQYLPMPTSTRYELGSGDLLKITFHRREDLSGQFRVREDNTVSLPLLGRFLVEGKDAADLEQSIAATFPSGSVNVEILERRPFYVVGMVGKSGAYPFVPGMTVLHALAQAGGPPRLEDNIASIALNVLQRVEENFKLRERLGRDQAKLERLLAERDGREVAEPSTGLVAVAGENEARELIAAERKLQKDRAAVRQEKRAGFAQQADISRKEAASLEEQLKQIQAQAEITDKQLGDAKRLDERQLLVRSRLYDLQRRVSEHQESQLRVQAEIHRALRTEARAIADQALVDREWKVEVENEITVLQGQLSVAQKSLAAAQGVMQQLPPQLTAMADVKGQGERRTEYKILRPTAGGYAVIQADETFPMRPGDVLRVTQSGL